MGNGILDYILPEGFSGRIDCLIDCRLGQES